MCRQMVPWGEVGGMGGGNGYAGEWMRREREGRTWFPCGRDVDLLRIMRSKLCLSPSSRCKLCQAQAAIVVGVEQTAHGHPGACYLHINHELTPCRCAEHELRTAAACSTGRNLCTRYDLLLAEGELGDSINRRCKLFYRRLQLMLIQSAARICINLFEDPFEDPLQEVQRRHHLMKQTFFHNAERNARCSEWEKSSTYFAHFFFLVAGWLPTYIYIYIYI